METILLFAPLIGALIAGFGWRLIGDKGAQWVTTGLLFLSMLLSWIVFLGHDGRPSSPYPRLGAVRHAHASGRSGWTG